MTVEERKALIEKYRKLWAEHRERNPNDVYVEARVRSMAGHFPRYGDKLENYPVLYIPVAELIGRSGHNDPEDDWWYLEVLEQCDDLKYFGTRCGRIPEADTVLGAKEVIDFLASFKVEFVAGCVPEEIVKDDVTEYAGIPLGAIAFKADAKVGEAFAYFINQRGGGLRCENHEDWCVFESE